MKNRRRTGHGDPVFNPKRHLRAWDDGPWNHAGAAELAARLRYTGNPAHKRNPGDFSLSPVAAPRLNATLCDEAGVTKRAEAMVLLTSGATKGLVDARLENNYPLLIWSVREDGVVFEARLENAAKGEYHGYPMPLSDPFRQMIVNAARGR